MTEHVKDCDCKPCRNMRSKKFGIQAFIMISIFAIASFTLLFLDRIVK